MQVVNISENGKMFSLNSEATEVTGIKTTVNFEYFCIPFTFTVNSHLFLKVLANSGFLVEI